MIKTTIVLSALIVRGNVRMSGVQRILKNITLNAEIGLELILTNAKKRAANIWSKIQTQARKLVKFGES